MTARGVLVVGCGNIAGPYAEDLVRHPSLRLIGAVDADGERARQYVARHGGRAYEDLPTALADPEVEIVANLTSHRSHVPVGRTSLAAGRHLYSEKPMAPTRAEADELLELAEAHGVLVGAAPIVALGELAQTARRWVTDGRLGTVRLAYADVNWGRIERWHPDPDAFYEIGPLYDVGVYPLTLLTAIFGPVRRIRADAHRLLPERRTKAGRVFEIGAPDCVLAILELEGGPVVRLTVDFYVADPARQRGVELHGDDGSLWLSNWFQFGGTLEHAPQGEPYREVPLLRQPEVVMPWATGLQDLADAIGEGRPPRAGGRHAAHVVEVMESILRSAQEDRPVEVLSDFAMPGPMPWAEALPLPD